jgi:hypothetical protein
MRASEGGGGGAPKKFAVVPEDLKKWSENIAELAPQAGKAKTYAGDHTDLDPSGGQLMVRFIDLTVNIDGDLKKFFGDLESRLSAAALELQKAGSRYRNLDHDAAAKADAAYWEA